MRIGLAPRGLPDRIPGAAFLAALLGRTLRAAADAANERRPADLRTLVL